MAVLMRCDSINAIARNDDAGVLRMLKRYKYLMKYLCVTMWKHKSVRGTDQYST